MSMSNEPLHRTQILDKLNTSMHKMEAAETRVSAAKSELGIASKELDKARDAYRACRNNLLKAIPDPDDDLGIGAAR